MPARPNRPIVLHRHELSGHCHRVELFLRLLGLPYECVSVDLKGGEQRRPDFLALNPFGQVPVIEDDGVVVADSNAILVYLATRYGNEEWLPRGAAQAAQVQRWLSVAAGALAFGAARARVVQVFGAAYDPAEAIERAHALLRVMESVLGAGQPFLAAAHPTIADIALYSYTAHAPEGNVSLDPYPAVRAWLARIEALPGFAPMRACPVGLAA